jgi:pimeloyl-ACP methyl ester carboxylesterase
MPSVILHGGEKIAYREAGRGAPGVGRSWSRVAQRLTARHRVLMPDLPGYGGSGPLSGGARARGDGGDGRGNRRPHRDL